MIRVWTYISANEGFFRRVLDYVSFMVAATCAAPAVRDVNVVIGTSPQLFTACAAWMVGTMKRVPWIFELRDIWPESIKAVGAMRDSVVIRLLEKVEMFLYRNASRIITVTHSFKRTLERRGIAGEKIDVVTNGVDLSSFAPLPKDEEIVEELGLNGKFVAGYIGTHGMAHGLETLLDAAAILKDLPEGKDIRILFLGDGARKAELVADARVRGLENVVFLDSVPKGLVARYWSLLDVSIIHLRKTELFETVIPSKLFECMGMGIPVLHGIPGESAEIVRRENVGDVFASGDHHQLVQVLLRIRNDRPRYEVYRQNCLQAAKRYERRELAAKMLDHIGELVRK